MGDNPQVRAMEVVTSITTTDVPREERHLAPKQKHLKRTANKYRSASRPAEPDNFDFVVFILIFLY